MEYYIKERSWKEILKFIRSIKGIHSKDEKRLRLFSMVCSQKWMSVEAIAKSL